MSFQNQNYGQQYGPQRPVQPGGPMSMMGGPHGNINSSAMNPGMNPSMNPSMNPGMNPNMNPAMNPSMNPGGPGMHPSGGPPGPQMGGGKMNMYPNRRTTPYPNPYMMNKRFPSQVSRADVADVDALCTL